jgi:hypothetical protein
VNRRPDIALSGVVTRSGPTASHDPAANGGVGVGVGGSRPEVLLDLIVSEPGLVIGRSHNPDLTTPSLVPWAMVACTSRTTGGAQAPDSPPGHVLNVEVADERWLGGVGSLTLRVPPTDLTPFLDAVAAAKAADPNGSPRLAGGAVGAAVGLLVGLRTSATRRMHSLQSGGGASHHGLGRRRVVPVVVGLLALAMLAGSTSVSFVSSASGAARRGGGVAADASGNRAQAAAVHLSPSLPAATSTPEPDPPSLASSAPLAPHEIFGYAPYWTLPESSGFDVQDLTTLAYFSVDANADGTLDESGAGWNGYESQDLVDLVNRSHAAGDRVVLTVTCFDQSSLDEITSDPSAATNLSSALIAAVSAKNLDGVNFDFEGQGSGDRNGLTKLITQVSGALHAANPHWQVTMATYASAAGDSNGFYDVAALAPAVDGFFVMAYDMNDPSSPSATAPLIGGSFNDTEALQQFTAVVPAQKIILGVPYYGYDWPTTDGTITAQASGAETPLSYGQIAASGHTNYWDPSTDTAWTSYQVGAQWHETYFDDPTSLAMKAQLASQYHIAGLGIWALGMDGNNPAMLAALLGNTPAVKDYETGPTATSSSPTSSTTQPGPAGSGFTTVGSWNGAPASLNPVAPPTSDGSAVYQGTLSQLSTTDPALACLQSGPALPVWTFSTLPGVDVVVASQPQDCATAMWTFPAEATTVGGGASTTTTDPPAPSTTTTTTTSTTTTTTTTEPSSTTTTSTP